MEPVLSGPLFYLGTVLGGVVGVYVGSYLSAVWLCLAVRMLRMPAVSYRRAFIASLIANFIIYGTSFSVGLNFAWLQKLGELSRQANISVHMGFLANPMFLFYIILFGIFVAALVYDRVLDLDDVELMETSTESRGRSYWDLFLLAACAQAIGAVVSGILVAIAILLLATVAG